MASGAYKQPSATPVRIPKLAVRNRVTDEDTPHDQDIAPSGTSPTDVDHTRDDRADSGPGGVADSSLMRQPRRPSIAVSTSPSKTKKKSSSMFGFLSVKEPSSKALEQFAEHQRKQAAQTGKSVLTGVSSQKLPENVPKVNSKWDGLPEQHKGKAKANAAHPTRPGHKRSNSATTNGRSRSNSSSRHTRKSDRSTTSTIDFDYGPPPSKASSSKSVRHDSGNGCFPEGVMTDAHAQTSQSSSEPDFTSQKSAFAPLKSKFEQALAETSASSQMTPVENRQHVAPEFPQSPQRIKEIAPWEEPPSSDADWPLPSPHALHTNSRPSHVPYARLPASSEAFLAGEAKELTLEDIESDSDPFISPRLPPSSNPHALARLESSTTQSEISPLTSPQSEVSTQRHRSPLNKFGLSGKPKDVHKYEMSGALPAEDQKSKSKLGAGGSLREKLSFWKDNNNDPLITDKEVDRKKPWRSKTPAPEQMTLHKQTSFWRENKYLPVPRPTKQELSFFQKDDQLFGQDVVEKSPFITKANDRVTEGKGLRKKLSFWQAKGIVKKNGGGKFSGGDYIATGGNNLKEGPTFRQVNSVSPTRQRAIQEQKTVRKKRSFWR